MIVVADTTPLCYLALLGEINILHSLYQKVVLPESVHGELQHARAPEAARVWASNLPHWCSVSAVMDARQEDTIDQLDAGERDAILLALTIGADTLLIDESDGRREAIRRHLHVTGTVAVLELAARRGLIAFRPTLERLSQTSFRLSPSLRNEFLRRNP